MDDRELLELAAKAAGIEVMRSRLNDPMNRDMLVRNSARNAHHENGPWNPLADDGDAFRLVVRLKQLGLWEKPYTGVALDGWRDDPYAAARRATVRAAADIGRAATAPHPK